jgi:porphobilinogen synthase
MFPMFIAEGENVQVEISMPGIFRRSIDLTVKKCKNYSI